MRVGKGPDATIPADAAGTFAVGAGVALQSGYLAGVFVAVLMSMSGPLTAAGTVDVSPSFFPFAKWSFEDEEGPVLACPNGDFSPVIGSATRVTVTITRAGARGSLLRIAVFGFSSGAPDAPRIALSSGG